jgi:multisubunit Na+/H+ antiporter MnhB subunit
MKATWPLIRAMPWIPLTVAAVLSAAVTFIGRDETTPWPLQVSAFLIASAAGFALDDPARESVDASPTSLRRRRAQRVVLVTVPTAILWLCLFWLKKPTSGMEAAALTATAFGLFGLSMAIASLRERATTWVRGGMAVAPTLVVALISSSILPPRWRPLPTGDIPGGWSAICTRWVIAGLLGLAVFVWSSRDPAVRAATIRRPGPRSRVATH